MVFCGLSRGVGGSIELLIVGESGELGRKRVGERSGCIMKFVCRAMYIGFVSGDTEVEVF